MADLTPGDPGPDQNDEAVNGWQDTHASAGGTPADGQPLADREQTFADADQRTQQRQQSAHARLERPAARDQAVQDLSNLTTRSVVLAERAERSRLPVSTSSS
jgi:hypothetical protein